MNKVDRAKKGVTKALLMAMIATVVVMIPVLMFAPWLVRFFNDKAEVVEIGTVLLRYITPFYALCCINQIYAGALRGAGNTRAPTVIMLCSFVAFRQIYLFVMSNYISKAFLAIAMGYPAGWLLCSAITLLYYKRVKLNKSRLVEDTGS
jgi:Na+-driven multidrug efflux pump